MTRERLLDAEDARFLRRAIEVARRSKRGGGGPFGAVLVARGEVVQEAADESGARCDPTWHAELAAIRQRCAATGRVSLEGHTLYASAEPCAMCAGAARWAGVTRVVFSVSRAMLRERCGLEPEPECAAVLNAEGPRAEIVGPALAEEGLAVFGDGAAAG